MNNTAVSQTVVQGLRASESGGEQVRKSHSGVPPQPTQSRTGGGEGSGFCTLTLMPHDPDATGL